MAKRFIDTNTFNDPFIISLKRDEKLLYIYFWTICDHAGIFEFNEPLGNFHLDCKDYQKRVENFKNCYPDKIKQLDENNYIIMNFCRRQYPKGVNTKVRQISGAIEILNSWNIEVVNNQMFTLRVKKGYIGVINPYGIGIGSGNGIGNGSGKEENRKKSKKEIIIPSLDEFKEYSLKNKPNVDVNSLELKYKSWVENGWVDGNDKPIKNWKSKILNTLPFIPEGKNKINEHQTIQDRINQFNEWEKRNNENNKD